MQNIHKKINIFLGIFTSIIIILLLKESFFHLASPLLFNKVSNNLYIESDLNSKDTLKISKMIESIKYELTNQMGEIQSSPTIIISESPNMDKKLNVVGVGGKANYFSLFNLTYISIQHHSVTKENIAHEMIHTELMERLHGNDPVSTWVNEGLAMQSDYLFTKTCTSHCEKPNIKDLEKIISSKEFYDYHYETKVWNYYTARNLIHIFLEKEGLTPFDVIDNYKKNDKYEDTIIQSLKSYFQNS